MKNKLLILFLLFFSCLSMNDYLLADDLIFETSTIEITNKGNTIFATNGSAKSSDGNIQIIADKFQYNKDSSLLKATGNVEVLDLLNKTSFKSENILYEINNKIILSNSESIIKDRLNSFFYLDAFSYNLSSNIVKMDKVKVIDFDNNRVEIDKAFLNLRSNKLIGKDLSINFNDKGFDSENEPRLKANSISSDESGSIMSKGVFTTCKKKDNCPPWQISAKEIRHDKKKKMMFYKDAWLKIYDKPVLYFPRFFHPDPSVKRQSGFLMPTFADSSTLGSSLRTPYFMVISENKDATIKPRMYFDNKLLVQSEYRQVNKNSDHIIDLSFLAGDGSSTKSHFFSKSKQNIDINNFDESELILQLQQVSNDTFLKKHKLKSPLITDENLLTNSLSLSAYRDDLNFDLNFRMYENLKVTNNDRYEYVFPSYNLSKEHKVDFGLNGDFSFNSSGYVKNYDTNITEKVIVNDLVFNSSPRYSNLGLKNEYNFLIKNSNSDSKNSTEYKNDPSLTMSSIFEYKSSYPLRKENKNDSDVLTPILSLRFSPNKSKNNRKENKRIDVNNIYSLNRISESDSVEGGGSITYGLEYDKSNSLSDKSIFSAKIANIFRFEEDHNLSKSSRIGQKTSDVVGNFNFDPNDNFKINYDFSLDENLKQSNYQLLSNQISVNNFINTFEYLNENNTPGGESYLTNEFAYKINNDKKLMFNTRVNKRTSVTEFYNLIYQYRNDCLMAAIEYNKDYYSDGDIKPEDNIFFKLTIIPFGETSSPNLKK